MILVLSGENAVKHKEQHLIVLVVVKERCPWRQQLKTGHEYLGCWPYYLLHVFLYYIYYRIYKSFNSFTINWITYKNMVSLDNQGNINYWQLFYLGCDKEITFVGFIRHRSHVYCIPNRFLIFWIFIFNSTSLCYHLTIQQVWCEMEI